MQRITPRKSQPLAKGSRPLADTVSVTSKGNNMSLRAFVAVIAVAAAAVAALLSPMIAFANAAGL